MTCVSKSQVLYAFLHRLSPSLPLPGEKTRSSGRLRRLRMGRGLLNSSREHTQSMFGLWVWKKHQELLTPYLQAASVVSLSWFFTCGVEIFSSSARASSADIPAFSAACGEVGGGQGCQCGGGCKLQRTLGFPSFTPRSAWQSFCVLANEGLFLCSRSQDGMERAEGGYPVTTYTTGASWGPA